MGVGGWGMGGGGEGRWGEGGKCVCVGVFCRVMAVLNRKPWKRFDTDRKGVDKGCVCVGGGGGEIREGG